MAERKFLQNMKRNITRKHFYRPKILNVTSIPSLSIGLLGRKSSPEGGQKRRSPDAKNGDELLQCPAIYEAESPDELALVHAARAYEVKLVKRTPRSAIVSFPDKPTLAFEILHVSGPRSTDRDNNKRTEFGSLTYAIACRFCRSTQTGNVCQCCSGILIPVRLYCTAKVPTQRCCH